LRILYICRIFSGFEKSLGSGKWEPMGTPTIFKMMNALDKGPHDVRFVMTARGMGADFHANWHTNKDAEVDLENFDHPILIIAGENRFTKMFRKFRGHLTGLARLYRVLREVRRFNPDLVYVDRSNVAIGAFLARFSGHRVFLRIMGIYPSMRELLTSRRIADRLQRWAFHSPFAYALCTEDGTGGGGWMAKALRDDVPRAIVLNGVSPHALKTTIDARIRAIPSNKMVFMFVGRLEAIKGCCEFVEACLSVQHDQRDKIHAVVIGTGTLETTLHARISDCNAEPMFTFIPHLPHDQIGNAHERADVYVSLNYLGNLSNANLECMNAGLCMIIPAARKTDGIDLVTDSLVPDDSVVRIAPDDMTKQLAERIHAFVTNPDQINQYQRSMKMAASTFIKNWDDRIAEEFELLELAGRS
jgi:glycosyltransferase involved in cell wall biosynthesis